MIEDPDRANQFPCIKIRILDAINVHKYEIFFRTHSYVYHNTSIRIEKRENG